MREEVEDECNDNDRARAGPVPALRVLRLGLRLRVLVRVPGAPTALRRPAR